MNVNDYLIDQAGKNWGQLLACWIPPLRSDSSLWLVNRLGEVIVTMIDGSVHLLDVGAGTLTQVANNTDHFARLLDTGNNADKWLRQPLVDACRKAGMTLAANECYGFKIPPALQGQYEVANLQPTPLARHYSLLAHFSKQDQIYWIAG